MDRFDLLRSWMQIRPSPFLLSESLNGISGADPVICLIGLIGEFSKDGIAQLLEHQYSLNIGSNPVVIIKQDSLLNLVSSYIGKNSDCLIIGGNYYVSFK